MNKNSDLRAILVGKIRKMLATHPDREKYVYLTGERFEPHEWVLDAMEQAYRMGLNNANFKGCF